MKESEMRKLFDESKNASITINVDDYRITMSGKLKPPISQYSHDLDPDSYRDYTYPYRSLSARKSIDLSLINPDDIVIEQVRWRIPLSIKPRIEND